MDKTEKPTKASYKHKFCEICQKDYKDYYQHKRIKHSDKEKNSELCIDCGKILQKQYMKRHKCSEVLKKARETWGIFCVKCQTFHMRNCTFDEDIDIIE